MSFEYINQNIKGNIQPNFDINKRNNNVGALVSLNNQYNSNPYQTSIYDGGIVSPFGILDTSLTNMLNSLNSTINANMLAYQSPQNPYLANVPYQTNFYNAQAIYPYTNFNLPYNMNTSYISLGQIKNEDDKVLHLYRLQNGQKVAILPVKDEATIVKTYLDGGSMNEKDRVRGISHTIEHCLFKGSSRLQDGDVFKLTGLMGASTNASTDYAQTDYYITAPYMTKDNLAKTIEIQGDMVSNPRFDADAIESEKNPICSEISMMNDDSTTVAFDKVIRNLFQLESESENMVAGSIETVSNLSRDDIVDHHKTYYTPDNLYTVVVGDVDPEETIKLIAKNFTLPAKTTSSKPQHKETLKPIQMPVREDLRSTKTNNTTVITAFAGPKPSNAREFVVYKVLNYYLSTISSSDFKTQMEDMNASYDSILQKVGLNDNDPYAVLGMMQLNPSDEQKGLDAFYDAIQKLQTTPLSDSDLQSVKNALKKDSKLFMSDSEVMCDTIGDAFLDKSFDLFTSYQSILDSISQEEIMEFAKKYYDLTKASIVVVHPANVTTEQIQANYNNSKYSMRNIAQGATNQNSFGNSVNLAYQTLNTFNSANMMPMYTPVMPQQANTNAYIRSAVDMYKPYNMTIVPTVGNVKVDSIGNVTVDTKSVDEMLLENNMHVALNKTAKDMCVFEWSVNTPPVKPKNPNIPAVLSYMFLKGSEYKNQSELERIKELNAIRADVYVNEKGIRILADCLPEHTSKTLLLMNELMYSPKLTQTDFEMAKKYVKDTLLASQKDASSNLLDRLYPGFFPTDAKMLKTIDDLTLDDVKEFYQNLLTSASSSFVATLPQNGYNHYAQNVIDIQGTSNVKFKKSTPKLTPIFQPTPEKAVIWDTDDLNQAQIYKTYKFPMSGNITDEVKFELVNTILGASPNARLFSDLREKQNLAYSVSSSISSFENTGILTLKIQTTTDNKEAGVQSHDNVKKSLEGFNKHTDMLCKELVSDEELLAAKIRLKQKLVGECQDPLSETGLLAMNILEPYGIGRIDKYLEAIDKITKEDIKKAANFIFSNNPTVSILASPDTISSQMDYLKTQGTLYQAQS